MHQIILEIKEDEFGCFHLEIPSDTLNELEWFDKTRIAFQIEDDARVVLVKVPTERPQADPGEGSHSLS